MDGASASPYPHLLWLNATFTFRGGAPPTGIHLRSVSHSVSVTLSGRHSLRWICRGRECAWTEQAGTVHFRPCDWDEHDFVVNAALSGDVFACFIPSGHMAEILRTESLAGVALDLGFSSQSHFTRLFSDLTGLTPARYRRQFRRSRTC